ncbi:coxsackievirus and adenovirus receptor-like isoform X2 [Neolamprologus brichardi]|uniref:coxsackievirus and adenovirus receptor-like isoform X1 n=1 Tax=Neolamprologus brichardi TaxID=32507 RepID=UPI00164378D7|nr:coxsackievirus and adenovirus receptor-like isoform X1 [Neolamprologus brichardi]XP_035771212.1 coxsackievirus and adenovirus receptor-like isoform X2 [Neolamprologus brichardi]
MSAGTCIFFCSILLLAGVFVSVSAEHKSIPVQSGQNVILPCQAPNDKGSIRVVKWTKPDLQKKIVHLYVDRRFDLEDQNPSFKNRVDLQDREMKNGDVSLILKDVTIDDAGTYECSVTQKKDLSPYITTITVDLDVINSEGQTSLPVERSVSGSVGLVIGLYLPVVLLVVAFVF